jgi:hypothetical protein
MLARFRKQLDETHYFHYVGEINIHVTKEQECPKTFIFRGEDGFCRLSRKSKIINDSNYPIIFRQPSVGNDGDLGAIEHLLENLDISENKGEILFEIYLGHSFLQEDVIKSFKIQGKKKVIIMKKEYDVISSISWDQEEDFIIKNSTILKHSIEFKQSKIIIPEELDEDIVIVVSGEIYGDLLIKNQSNYLVRICDRSDDKLIWSLQKDNILCVQSILKDDSYFNTYDMSRSILDHDSYNPHAMGTPFPSPITDEIHKVKYRNDDDVSSGMSRNETNSGMSRSETGESIRTTTDPETISHFSQVATNTQNEIGLIGQDDSH